MTIQKQLFDKSKIQIPTYHKNDTRYKKYCVDCGVLLIEWECEFDGIESWAGKIIFSTRYYFDFGGKRCEKCYQKLKLWIEEYYI